MSIQEILLAGGGTVGVILLLVEIAPVKVNPLKYIAKFLKLFARWLGRAITADVLEQIDEVKKTQKETQEKLDEVKETQKKTQERLDEHIQIDGENNADLHRARILQFNNEMINDVHHTREDFIEVLAEIDKYERYCEEHPHYENNRAVHAIANIERVYDECLRKRSFAEC